MHVNIRPKTNVFINYYFIFMYTNFSIKFLLKPQRHQINIWWKSI